MNTLSDKLLMIADKIASQKYIKAIKNAFTTMMPLIITGAFATLLKSVLFDGSTGLAQFGGLEFLTQFQPIAGAIQYGAMYLMTILALILIGLELGKINGISGYLPAVLPLVCFITLVPTVMNVSVEGVDAIINNVLLRDYTDVKSLFLGMFAAIGSIELYTALLKVKFLKIRMPDTVPGNVADSFSALLPVILTVTIVAVFGFTFEKIFGLTLYQTIYNLVQRPLEGVLQGLPGLLLLMFVAQIFWVIGIHGNQMIKPIREPILLAAIVANSAGAENIITMPFWDMYMSMGGSGVTIGLVIAIFLVSKRSEYKAVAKLSLIPGLFNINETMIFGLPIILNPILAIPFILTPLVTGTIGYFLTASGFAAVAVNAIPWTTPPILSAILATNGNMGAVITQIICIVVSVLIYLPFVIVSNKKKDEVEA